MKIVLGKFFRFLNVFFYFSPILFANYRWRKYLKVLYQLKNERAKRKNGTVRWNITPREMQKISFIPLRVTAYELS